MIGKHCTFTEFAAPPVTCHSPEQLLQGAPAVDEKPYNSAGSDSGASVSAPSQPEPPHAKSCSSQIAFWWGSLLFPSPAYSKVACALTPGKDQRDVHWGEVKQLQEFAHFFKSLYYANFSPFFFHFLKNPVSRRGLHYPRTRCGV